MSHRNQPPAVYWAQGHEKLYLTFEIEDFKVDHIALEGKDFFVSGTTSDGSVHSFTLWLYADCREVMDKDSKTEFAEFTIKKGEDRWWPQLEEHSAKFPWVKVDFHRYVYGVEGSSAEYDSQVYYRSSLDTDHYSSGPDAIPERR
uniref:CS domain-containing protein n=1 Tax=Panagrellus redivivus TaxID=6233 RepID=A0A7E4VYV2_PANRE